MPTMLRLTGGSGANSSRSTPTTQLIGNTAQSSTKGTEPVANRVGT